MSLHSNLQHEKALAYFILPECLQSFLSASQKVIKESPFFQCWIPVKNSFSTLIVYI